MSVCTCTCPLCVCVCMCAVVRQCPHLCVVRTRIHICCLFTPLCLVRALREEIQLLHEPGSHVGEVIKKMGKGKVLVKVRTVCMYICACVNMRTRRTCLLCMYVYNACLYSSSFSSSFIHNLCSYTNLILFCISLCVSSLRISRLCLLDPSRRQIHSQSRRQH